MTGAAEILIVGEFLSDRTQQNKLMIAAVAVLAVFALFVVLKSKETGEKHAHTEPVETAAPAHGHSHDKVPAFQTTVDATK